MIPEKVREEIQRQYRAFLKGNEFGPRSGQRQMIATITRTLWHSSASPICAVEAGTGTGKTLAYLLPALATARAKGKQLVVSTATVALQEQLINKDLPAIKRLGEMDFTYALAKGRGRYACNLKLDQAAGSQGDHPVFMEAGPPPVSLYQSLQDALQKQSWDGDRDHWPDAISDRDWRPLITDRYQCLNRRCPQIAECVFFRAREELGEVDCLVTNHDLLLADMELGGGVILPPPEEAIYVFDEAHHLVDKARNHFATMARLSLAEAQIEQGREALARLESESGSGALVGLAGELAASLDALTQYQQAIGDYLQDRFQNTSQECVRFPHGKVETELQELCSKLAVQWRTVTTRLGAIRDKLELAAEGDNRAERSLAIDWLPMVGQLEARSENLARAFHAFADDQEEAVARWIDIDPRRQDFSLRAIPLRPGKRLREGLWNEAAGVVLTSATLTALNSFSALQENLALPEDAQLVQIPSPFDFAGRGQLVVPADCPDAGDARAHDEYLATFLPGVFTEARGTLVLFASDRQMQHLAERVAGQSSVEVLVQGTHSKQEILRRHRERIDMGETSVIFGLASFAEGIDLPGEYCSHVIIAKIPFPVPEDPVIESLGEWMQAQGRNAFASVMLPAASLSLVQAVGRLLRSDEDSGRVTILDRRLVSRGYGKRLMNSLPPFSRTLNN